MSESTEPADASPEQPTPEPPAESRIRELTVRLDDIEAELERKDSSLRAVRSGQEELAESIDEVNDTVRQLLGVYDQLTTEQNPFAEPDEPLFETAGDGAAADAGEPAAGQVDASARVDVAGPASADGRAHESAPDDDTVSFDDLRDGSEEEFLWEAEEPAEEPVDDGPVAESAEGLWLGSLPAGYAGDVLVMEWLAVLMSRTGPAGAFRAVRHYEEIGWISPEVKRGLVDLLGGPDLDLHVDPSRPAEPTAADHQDSVSFIRTLRTLAHL